MSSLTSGRSRVRLTQGAAVLDTSQGTACSVSTLCCPQSAYKRPSFCPPRTHWQPPDAAGAPLVAPRLTTPGRNHQLCLPLPAAPHHREERPAHAAGGPGSGTEHGCSTHRAAPLDPARAAQAQRGTALQLTTKPPEWPACSAGEITAEARTTAATARAEFHCLHSGGGRSLAAPVALAALALSPAALPALKRPWHQAAANRRCCSRTREPCAQAQLRQQVEACHHTTAAASTYPGAGSALMAPPASQPSAPATANHHCCSAHFAITVHHQLNAACGSSVALPKSNTSS